MLKNVLFFYSYSKNRHANSAARSVIIHQTSAFIILLCWNLSLLLSNFCWCGTGVQSLVFYQAQDSLAMLLISHYGFWKLYNYIELSKPSFNSGLSRKDERIENCYFPKTTSGLARFFLQLHA